MRTSPRSSVHRTPSVQLTESRVANGSFPFSPPNASLSAREAHAPSSPALRRRHSASPKKPRALRALASGNSSASSRPFPSPPQCPSRPRSLTPHGDGASVPNSNSPMDRALSPVSWRHNPYANAVSPTEALGAHEARSPRSTSANAAGNGLARASLSGRERAKPLGTTVQIPGGPTVTVSKRTSVGSNANSLSVGNVASGNSPRITGGSFQGFHHTSNNHNTNNSPECGRFPSHEEDLRPPSPQFYCSPNSPQEAQWPRGFGNTNGIGPNPTAGGSLDMASSPSPFGGRYWPHYANHTTASGSPSESFSNVPNPVEMPQVAYATRSQRPSGVRGQSLSNLPMHLSSVHSSRSSPMICAGNVAMPYDGFGPNGTPPLSPPVLSPSHGSMIPLIDLNRTEEELRVMSRRSSMAQEESTGSPMHEGNDTYPEMPTVRRSPDAYMNPLTLHRRYRRPSPGSCSLQSGSPSPSGAASGNQTAMDSLPQHGNPMHAGDEEENEDEDVEAHCATLRPNEVKMQLRRSDVCTNSFSEMDPEDTYPGLPEVHHSHTWQSHDGARSRSPHDKINSSDVSQNGLKRTLRMSRDNSELTQTKTLSRPHPSSSSSLSEQKEYEPMEQPNNAAGPSQPQQGTPTATATSTLTSNPVDDQQLARLHQQQHSLASLSSEPLLTSNQLEQMMLLKPTEEVGCVGGFYFSVYDADVQQHYAIESSKIVATRGSVRYLALFELHRTQSRFRFQLCKRYLQSNCLKGMNCQYIHAREVPDPTKVHINENVISAPAIERREITEEELRGGKNTHGYVTMPPGTVFRVFPPNQAKMNPQLIDSSMVLHTVGAASVYSVLAKADNTKSEEINENGAAHDPIPSSSTPTADGATSGLDVNHLKPRHCAHFQFNKMCNLGMSCNFIHSLVPYVQESAPPAAFPSPPPLVPSHWTGEVMFAPSFTPAMPYPFPPPQTQMPHRPRHGAEVPQVYNTDASLVPFPLYPPYECGGSYFYDGQRFNNGHTAVGVPCGYSAQPMPFCGPAAAAEGCGAIYICPPVPPKGGKKPRRK